MAAHEIEPGVTIGKFTSARELLIDFSTCLVSTWSSVSPETETASAKFVSADQACIRRAEHSSQSNLYDQKDKYVVHFYLSEENVSNVRVNFDDGQLHLRAKKGSSATSQNASGTSQQATGGPVKVTGEYTATITVPGPVNEDQMKVDRQANAVVVTLPKA